MRTGRPFARARAGGWHQSQFKPWGWEKELRKHGRRMTARERKLLYQRIIQQNRRALRAQED